MKEPIENVRKRFAWYITNCPKRLPIEDMERLYEEGDIIRVRQRINDDFPPNVVYEEAGVGWRRLYDEHFQFVAQHEYFDRIFEIAKKLRTEHVLIPKDIVTLLFLNTLFRCQEKNQYSNARFKLNSPKTTSFYLNDRYELLAIVSYDKDPKGEVEYEAPIAKRA